MTALPANPKIFHITHAANVAPIAESGVLWSDAKCIELDLGPEVVGIGGIKKDRLYNRVVKCHWPTKVGEYVPFNLCPRSVMLYIFHMDDRPELTYHGGQEPIVHLVADLKATVAWAEQTAHLWAISDCNAAAKYARFYGSMADLSKIDWDGVKTDQWGGPGKDAKQAEFLVHEEFPWTLVEKIGVHNPQRKAEVEETLRSFEHRPPVVVERAWYYQPKGT